MLSLFTIMRKTPRKTGLKPGEVVLTFDDGPNLEDNVTPNLLNVLHRHSVKAGFCVVGNQIHKHPDVIQRMHYSGHLLINHTQTHQHPMRQDFSALDAEVEACDRELGAALDISDYRSDYFRAPFGIVTLAVRKVVRRRRMKQVLLSHYGWDTRVGPQNYTEVVDKLINNAKRCCGGMFVFHDGSLCPPKIVEPDWKKSSENRSWVPEAVDRVISELKAEGMQFVLPSTPGVEEARSSVARAA